MLVEIDKKTIDNQDVRSAIRTLRWYGMHPFVDGYYYAYLTDEQYISLLNDPKIIDIEQWSPPKLIVGALPSIYGTKFFRIHEKNQPARFYGSHLPMREQKIELVEVNP